MPKKEKIYVTEDGLKELQEELNELITVRRPNVIEALKEARALGDLSENAEYDSARNEQAEVEGRITVLEKTLEQVEVIKDADTDVVSIGNTVEIEYIDDKEKESYMIVGSQEVDPFANKISNESPLAKALLNKKAKEVTTVYSPNGTYDVKILKIS